MIIASIDIGTNTILLLIAKVDLNDKNISAILNEYRTPRIGKGLLPGEEIHEEKISDLFLVLDEYNILIKKYKCEEVIITATNALRISSNGKAITNRIKDEFGYEVNIVSGDDEAKLSYLGAVNSISDVNQNLVIDIGGGSTELVIGKGRDILFKKSFLIGVVSGSENYLNFGEPSIQEIVYFQNELGKIFRYDYLEKIKIESAIAIAGTPTTLACLKQNLNYYDEVQIEGSILSLSEIEYFVNALSQLSPKDILTKYSAVVHGREDVLLCGTIILNTLMKILNLNSIVVSTKGIRYGAIVDFMTERK